MSSKTINGLYLVKKRNTSNSFDTKVVVSAPFTLLECQDICNHLNDHADNINHDRSKFSKKKKYYYFPSMIGVK